MHHDIDISDDQIAQYQRDGAILLHGIIGSDDLALLEQGLEEAHADPGDRYTRVRSTEGEGETLVEQFPSLHCPSLRALVERSPVAEIAARLMRVATAQFILDQVFYKASGHVNPTPWHQDTPFLRVRGEQMARVWLSCDPSPRDLTVQVVRGSHRWNIVYDTKTADSTRLKTAEGGEGYTYSGMGDAGLPTAPDIASYRDSFDILSWDVEPGDALVFNGNVLHGTQSRRDHPHRRRAFATLWGGPDLCYHEPRGNAIPVPVEGGARPVPHGARIGDYADVFPVGWRAAESRA